MTTFPARLLAPLRRIARASGPRLALFAALALIASWQPLSKAGALNDFRDAHLLQNYEDVAVRTLRAHGQLPLWNPWACGGMYALGNPQTRVGAPTVLLSTLLGARRAEPFLLFAFLVLGMEGAFRYARLRHRGLWGPLLAAPLFALSGYIAISWTLGWINFFGFLLMPWLLYGTARAAQGRLSGVALVASGFAFMIGFGGTYPVPLCALFVALEGVRCLLQPPRAPQAPPEAWRLRAVTFLGAAALFAVAASAYRLWPILDVLESAPRVMAGRPSNHILDVIRMTLAPAPLPGANQGRTGIFFVGPAALLLCGGAVFSRRAIAPAVLTGLAVWLATGYAATPSVFAALRELPVFSTLRYPERFLLPGAVYLVELAAVSFVAARALRGRGPLWRWAVPALVVVGLVGVGMSLWNFERISRRAQLREMPAKVDQPFAQARGNRWVQSHFVAMNRGSINCGEAYPVPMSPALRGDLAAEEYLSDPSAGTAERLHWSPNRLVVEVKARSPVDLVLNGNWHPGWRTNVGEVKRRDGLLAVALPEGTHRVVLSFWPRSAVGGALVTVLAFGALAVLAGARRRGRLTHPAWPLAGALLPLLAWAVVALAWREPRLPPDLRNPDGSAIEVPALPDGATSGRASFPAVNTQLEGAWVPAQPDEEGRLRLALYWRVTGRAPHSVSVFVHLKGPDDTTRVADHDVIAGTWFFKNAPRDVLLQDVFGVNALDYPPGEWRVLVGLWHARGDRSRVRALDAAGQSVPNHSVEVGRFTVPERAEKEE